MSATVTAIRQAEVTCLRALRLLPENRRRELLEELASAIVVGPDVPPVPEVVEVQVIAWSSPSLSPAEALERWGKYVAEMTRWANWAGDDADFRDRPGFYEEDLQAAQDDLVLGTDRYHGDRA
jgi:hypothetical protein